MTRETLAVVDWVTALKAAAEPTRLRLLVLLAANEFNVKDLTLILGQSQPRLSRHLKLLSEAGLVERYREGSWVYFHLSDRSPIQRRVKELLGAVDPADAIVLRDCERASALKRERESTAQAFFRAHAGDWDRIRALHVSETEVESAMRTALGDGPFRLFIDLGTGTGRILELFDGSYERGLGIDVNQAMLTHARSKLSAGGLYRAQVRHGDIYNLGFGDGTVSVVTMHQVLHFLSDPRRAVMEAARVLEPGGKLLIVDFAPHELEFLRETQAHDRLGFSAAIVGEWLEEAGLEPRLARDLKPAAATANAAGKLTVSIWLAERPRVTTSPQPTRTEARIEGTR